MLFRDRLRAHPEDQHRYERVKRHLAALYRLERQRYTEAKGNNFWEIIRSADLWAVETGWEPRGSDA